MIQKSAGEATALSEAHPIVFFDGVCGLCSFAIQQLMKHDSAAKLRFAPLQGETAKVLLSDPERAQMQSLIVLKKGRYFKRSDAVIEALLELGGGFRRLGQIAKLCPRSLRDKFYDLIAENRFRIWKKSLSCRRPTPAEQHRFLP